MAVEGFSMTPMPYHEVLTHTGVATIDGKQYPVHVRRVKTNGIHKSTNIRLAQYPPNMNFDQASDLEDQLASFTENNDVW